MAAPLKSALSSSPMKWAVGGWSLFIAENLILSENRTYLISELGDDNYHYLYGLASTAAVGSIVYGYRYKIRGSGPFLWRAGMRPPPAALAGSLAIQALALGMASQSLPKLQVPVHLASAGALNPTAGSPAPPAPQVGEPRRWKVRCPFDFTESRSHEAHPSIRPDGAVDLRGLDRVSRHPGLWSLGLLGVGNALLTPSLPMRVWMSMPLAVALVGGGHTDSRHRRGMGGELCPEVDAATSNVPFLAMLAGRQEGGSAVKAFEELGKEIKWLNAALAAGVAAGWVARRGRGGPPAAAAAALAR